MDIGSLEWMPVAYDLVASNVDAYRALTANCPSLGE